MHSNRLKRREFIGLLGGTALVWPAAARGQHPSTLAQVGVLDPGFPHHFDAFRRGMRDLGYLEGQNVSFIYRSAGGRAEGLPALASELVGLKPHVIVTASPLFVRAVSDATSTIPIVFAAVGDAIAAGVVNSLAHPGGNVTGLSFLNVELSAKRLELLLEALPEVRRVAVLWDANTPRRWVAATEEASRGRGVAVQVLEVTGPETFESAFEAARARADALDILSSGLFNANKARLVELAAKYRLPTVYEHDDFVRAGGLMGYGPSIPDLFRRAAIYVDKILKGAKPGDLPVEQPTKFLLVINLTTAKALGLNIPPTLLARADEVIE
ncbi:MAG: ABC transporter substrate-binding protein [Xanthobacteraceae bacterium]